MDIGRKTVEALIQLKTDFSEQDGCIRAKTDVSVMKTDG